MFQFPDKESVSKDVETAIKKEGTFDEIRRKILDKVKSDGLLEELESRAKADVRDILQNLPATTTKEQMRMRIKDFLAQGTYNQRINDEVTIKTNESWVGERIETEVRKKVRAAYNLDEVEDFNS